MSERNIQELRQLIEQGSSNLDDYTKLAEELASCGDVLGAIELYRRALILSLDDVQRARTMVELGICLCQLGEDQEARVIVDEVGKALSDKKRTVEARVVEALRLTLHACVGATPGEAMEALESARSKLEQLIDSNSLPATDERWLTSHAAVLAISAEEYEKTIRLCQGALSKSMPLDERLGFMGLLAEALRQEGRLEESESMIRQGLELAREKAAEHPANAKLYLELCTVKRLQDCPDEALDSIRKAIELLPRQIVELTTFGGEHYLELGNVLYELERYEEAAAAYGGTLKVRNVDDTARRFALFWQGKSYLAIGQDDEAKQSFTELLRSPHVSDEERTNVDVALVLNSAVSRYEAEEYDDAARLFEDVLANQESGDPDRVNTLHWLGHSYCGSERYEAARRCYQQMLESPSAAEYQKSAAKEALDKLSGL